ncbi:MAG: TRAP transporter permease [Deltaproteobacteria bacterium]|jgi:TRAP transporter 4TM/12TM fusion protein|nr:TRAP transporter permease [Deltaproteobacteria bacterium]
MDLGNSQLLLQIIEKETGRRKPRGLARAICLLVPLIWALWQLWITSPLPFSLGFGIFNDTAARSLHLAFALFLAFVGFPLLRDETSGRIPWYDWLLALAAAFCAGYLFLFQADLASRAGRPEFRDLAVACLGMLLLLEATRRVMGLPMTIVGLIFIVYAFAGPYAPDLIAHKGATLQRAASQFWTSTEGVFGVPLGVSTSFVFVFVLFGALLEGAGAGRYLTTLAFALLGHFRGGPAKAAVVASGLHGLISGSSIANVLTCGPVTIMLMKKVGFSAEKAGAVEVAAGSNGQIMPPVMGAAAFLMVEYTNIPYSDLIRHAFVPALLAYASLLYIVHLEACKLEMEGLPRQTPLRLQLLGWGVSISFLILLVGALYYLTAWIPLLFGALTWLILPPLLFGVYLALLYISTRYPGLPEDNNEALLRLPRVLPVLCSGLHFLAPILALVWCLMALKMSPGLAAFYACLLLSFILLTQWPLLALLRKEPVKPALLKGCSRLFSSYIAGARNMVGIGLATASAGIVVGSVSLTGVGQVLAGVVEVLSMGSLPLLLVLTAVFCLILGMGLPTTANYIIVSTLLAPVISSLTSAHGMVTPLVAIHLFCLYFGVMADATPPVALAAFAAAGVSGGDPFKTGVQGFLYEMRTAILPFVFLFNPEILLINVESIPHLLWVIATAALACMAFASVTQNYLLTRNRIWESLLLLAVTAALFRPEIFRDRFFPPYQELPANEIVRSVEELQTGEILRLRIASDNGSAVRERYIAIPAPEGSAAERLASTGLVADIQGESITIRDIEMDSHAEKIGLSAFDSHRIMSMEIPRPQPPKFLFSLPGLLLLSLVFISQKRRKAGEDLLRKR